jgi:threonylcarbamoyladenosine tRNA methylthiotransferase MtaB
MIKLITGSDFMKVGIYSLGCKVNLYESEYVESLLKKKGYEIVDFNDKADIYIINTCSVTNESDRKSRKIINEAKRKNEESIIVVMGCYTQLFGKDTTADIVIGNKDKSKIVELIEEYINKKQMINKVYDLSTDTSFENMEIDHFENHTRAFVKIQDGCNAFCSYCIIPYTRGIPRSKKESDVIKEVTGLVENGYKEIVLTGIHTGRYGTDLEDTNLEQLLRKLVKIPNIYRIRLSSIEINEVTDGILDLMRESNIIASHLHIPIQSGSDRILRLMNRKYDINYFIKRIEEIRKVRDDISITTDLIVGFPGETQEDFQDTINTLEEIKFTKIHTFPYSKREGTPASKMPDQVNGIIKKKRVSSILELSNKFENSFYKKYINTIQEGVAEVRNNGTVIVHSSNFIPIIIEDNSCKNNEIISLKITKIEDNKVYGIKQKD